MSDLVEFLTARYDEDEAVADRALSSPASAEIDNYGRLILPARRVLADIAAKRRILDEHRPETVDESWGRAVTYCRVCCYDGGLDRDMYPCKTVRLLASPYSDHPDFNPDWRTEP